MPCPVVRDALGDIGEMPLLFLPMFSYGYDFGGVQKTLH